MGQMNEGMFTSNTNEWGTPKAFFAMLDAEFAFTLDACATEENAKCEPFFTIEDDALARDWSGVVWMNPPYGRGIGQWVAKARSESLKGSTVVCLIPARTDTAYWHEHVMCADEIRFVRGRLHFEGGHEGSAHNAPFPCAVIVFQPTPGSTPRISTQERE